MKKIYCLLLLLSGIHTFSQTTFVPDDNFEQALINLGYDDVLDDFVLTENIINVTGLQLEDFDIFDLTGIEGFSALRTLDLSRNFLTSLDVSQNVNLELLDCAQINTLIVLNIQNGFNENLRLGASSCPNLLCVQVDDIDFVTANINSLFFFNGSNNYTLSLDCTNLSVEDFETQKVSMYPNPAKDVLFISGTNPIQTFKIYNTLGALVKSGLIHPDNKIDIRNLSPGVYILKGDRTKSVKFIKE